MNIPHTAEYALRAITWLARGPSAVVGAGEIARATLVPADYLSKVLQALARAGLVTSTAGRKGGFRLARPASEISLLDVVRAVGPFERIRRCPLGIESHGGSLCPLHRRLDEAMQSIEKSFAATTIAELLHEDHGPPPLCDCVDGSAKRKGPDFESNGRGARARKRGRRSKCDLQHANR